MALTRQQRTLLGGGLIAAGLGVGAYVYAASKAGLLGSGAVGSPSVSFTPPLGRGLQLVTARVSWTNTSRATVTYGVQGDWFGGDGQLWDHLWTDQNAMQAAQAAYSRGDMNTVNAYVQSPGYRVARVTVGPDQTGQATLYGHFDVEPGFTFAFWVYPNPPANQLLVPDVQPVNLRALPQPTIRLTVQGS